MRWVDHSLLAILVAATLTAVAAQPAMSDDTELQAVERQLEADRQRAQTLERERRRAAAELEQLRRDSIAAAQKSQRHETRLAELEASLADLGKREKATRTALSRRNFEMSGTLAALERISRNPPQTMLAFPDAPIQMVRSAMLLRGALPRVRAEADELAEQLNELARIREQTGIQLAKLGTETAELEQEQRQLADLLSRKSNLLKKAVAERQEIDRRIGALSKRAASIRDLLAQIEADRKRREAEEQRRQEADRSQASPDMVAAMAKPTGLRPFPSSGPITSPTSAKIIRHYGERGPAGNTERGITFETRPGAQIVAPHDGQIVFSGPFESYGEILIIEHDGGYHTLLAGLERLDVALGQWVLAGEPVGAMGQQTTDVLGETQGLYLELRRKGQPINPLGWIAGGNQNRTRG